MKTVPALKSCDGITEEDVALFKKNYDPKQKSSLQKALEFILCGKTEDEAIKILEDFLNSDKLNGRAKRAGEKIKEKIKILRFQEKETPKVEALEEALKSEEKEEKEEVKEEVKEEKEEKEEVKEEAKEEVKEEVKEEKEEKEEKEDKVTDDDLDEFDDLETLLQIEAGSINIGYAIDELRVLLKDVKVAIDELKKQGDSVIDKHQSSSEVLNNLINKNKEQISQIGQLTPVEELKRVSIIKPEVMLPLDIQNKKVSNALTMMRRGY